MSNNGILAEYVQDCSLGSAYLATTPQTQVQIPARAVGMQFTELLILPLVLINKWVSRETWKR